MDSYILNRTLNEHVRNDAYTCDLYLLFNAAIPKLTVSLLFNFPYT